MLAIGGHHTRQQARSAGRKPHPVTESLGRSFSATKKSRCASLELFRVDDFEIVRGDMTYELHISTSDGDADQRLANQWLECI